MKGEGPRVTTRSSIWAGHHMSGVLSCIGDADGDDHLVEATLLGVQKGKALGTGAQKVSPFASTWCYGC